MRELIYEHIERLTRSIRKKQCRDGSWDFPFETGISTDCYTIILLRTLEINDEQLIEELAERIIQKQEENGAWKLFFDEEEGNVTTTVEAYYALLYSGHFSKQHPRMKMAEKFIKFHGGIEATNMFMKMMLALTGQHPWPPFFPFPVEFILVPTSFPVHFYSLSVYGRANLAPLMILADKKFAITRPATPDISHLYKNKHRSAQALWNRSSEWHSYCSAIKAEIKNLLGLSGKIRNYAITRLKQYMLNHIEPDGTLFSYYSSTFLLIFALLAMGHPVNDPLISNAVNGIMRMKTKINGLPHLQYTTANVWNTALISYALQKAGMTADDEMIKRATQYLISRQHGKYGDWVIDNPRTLPGGWGFSDINTINPDVDDTSAALRAIIGDIQKDSAHRAAWERGISWLLSMQNHDGGWPAFERNKNNPLLKLLPFENGEFFLFDPSSADLTGRTLELIGNFTNLPKSAPQITQAARWLIDRQEPNGSWNSRWGICFIYGTWAAVTGLKAVEIPSKHTAVKKAVNWLEAIQNADGGWGESCRSDIKQWYIPLGASTIVHTAWALDALIAACDYPTTAISKGMNFLIQKLERDDDWTAAYPSGQGMAGAFYIHYHSYRYVFPLVTLAAYKRKYLEGSQKH